MCVLQVDPHWFQCTTENNKKSSYVKPLLLLVRAFESRVSLTHISVHTEYKHFFDVFFAQN